MTLEFFYKNYDLKNLDINSIVIKDKKLIINVCVIAHLELIANGYRPELDVDHNIEFIFDIDEKDMKFNKSTIDDISYQNGILNIVVDSKNLKITNDFVLVKQKS